MLAREPVKGTIACVLKSGGDFTPEHVYWLRSMCRRHMPDWDFVCWSDMDVEGKIPLYKNWPKWWSKMEIYATPFGGPALVVDLDTVFLDRLEILKDHEEQMLVIRDPWKNGFRHPERLAGGFMYLPRWARDEIWAKWSPDPEGVIAEFAGDDQPFLHRFWGSKALRFQDHYTDQIVSYKVNTLGVGIQPENKVVYFHGTPRPWELKLDWIPRLQ